MLSYRSYERFQRACARAAVKGIGLIRMTKLIFVRHGQSIGNLNGRYLGNYDGELTELGREQARRAADFLKDEQIDAAYSSDLIRAYETGAIIAEKHGLVPIKEQRLREIFAGKWENMEFTKIAELYPGDWSVWQNDAFSSRPTGGEAVTELKQRVTEAIWQIAFENDGKTVLIATHATPIRALMREWGELNALPEGPKWVSNASLTTAEYDAAAHRVKVLSVSECSYLKGLETDLPKNV